MSEMNCKDCPYESVIEELRRDSQRNSEQHREFYANFSAQEKALAISGERYTNLLSMIGDIKTSVEKMSTSISEMKEKPAKKWEQVTAYVLTCIVGLVIGYLFNIAIKGGM